MLQMSKLAGAVLAAAFVSGQAIAAESPSPEALSDRLELSGSFRVRYESLSGQYRPGLEGGDQLVSLRTTLQAKLDLDRVVLGGELTDARAYLSDAGGSVGTGEVNALEPSQVYLSLRLGGESADKAPAEMTAGRFALDLGSRRLVGRNNFRNTTNAFTGLKFDWRTGAQGRLVAFYVLPHTRLPDSRADVLDNAARLDDESWKLRLWGVLYAFGASPLAANAEVYVLGLDESDASDRATRDRDLTTVGARIYRSPKSGRFDFEAEGAWQSGRTRGSTNPTDVTDLDVDAHFLHVEAGRKFASPWSPRLVAVFDKVSGDKNPADRQANRFDTLYGPRRSDFGPTGIYGPLGRSNIFSPGVRLELAPSKAWDGQVFYRALWLDEARDAFSNTGVKDASGAAGDFAGHQLEVRARRWLVDKRVRMDVGGAYLARGRFLKRAPNATDGGDTLYGYIDVTSTF